MGTKQQLLNDIELLPEQELQAISIIVRAVIDTSMIKKINENDRIKTINDAIAYRKEGGKFLTGEESIAMLKSTIEGVVGHEI